MACAFDGLTGGDARRVMTGSNMDLRFDRVPIEGVSLGVAGDEMRVTCLRETTGEWGGGLASNSSG